MPCVENLLGRTSLDNRIRLRDPRTRRTTGREAQALRGIRSGSKLIEADSTQGVLESVSDSLQRRRRLGTASCLAVGHVAATRDIRRTKVTGAARIRSGSKLIESLD